MLLSALLLLVLSAPIASPEEARLSLALRSIRSYTQVQQPKVWYDVRSAIVGLMEGGKRKARRVAEAKRRLDKFLDSGMLFDTESKRTWIESGETSTVPGHPCALVYSLGLVTAGEDLVWPDVGVTFFLERNGKRWNCQMLGAGRAKSYRDLRQAKVMYASSSRLVLVGVTATNMDARQDINRPCACLMVFSKNGRGWKRTQTLSANWIFTERSDTPWFWTSGTSRAGPPDIVMRVQGEPVCMVQYHPPLWETQLTFHWKGRKYWRWGKYTPPNRAHTTDLLSASARNFAKLRALCASSRVARRFQKLAGTHVPNEDGMYETDDGTVVIRNPGLELSFIKGRGRYLLAKIDKFKEGDQ
jgi:hypothetical protein